MKHLDEGALQAWIDRIRSGLDAAERERIERHLATCRECERRLHELEEVDRRAASILSSAEPTDQTIPDFGEVLERSHKGRPRPRRPRWIAAAWAASLVGALVAGWLTNDLYRDGMVAPGPGAAPERAQAPPVAREETLAEGPQASGSGSADEDVGSGATEVAPDPSGVGVSGARAIPRSAAEIPADSGPVEPAEASLEVTGRVTDEEGRPVPSAQVHVPDVGVGTLTDEDGTFRLTLPSDAELADGEIEIAAERIGFAPATVEVSSEGGDPRPADIRLREEALALDAVTVTGAARGWTSVDREGAEETAGFPILLVPGLEVLAIEIREDAGVPVARIRQAVDSGTVLTLVESRNAVSGPAAGIPMGPDSTVTTVTSRRGDVWITGSAPVVADSLRALVQRVR